MRRFFDLVSRQLVDDFFQLIRHVREQPAQPIDLFALIDNNTVQFVDRVIGVSQIDFQPFKPGFLILRHVRSPVDGPSWR